MRIYLDIESIPGQSNWVREHIAKTVKHPATHKKPESIERWYAEKAPAAIDEAWRKTALNATLGEIIVIGWAIDDGLTYSVSRMPEESEFSLLTAFFAQLSQTTKNAELENINDQYNKSEPVFAGHNVLFDLGFIWKRSIINNVAMTTRIPYDEKPWSKAIIDTCQMWKGNSRDSASMSVLCKAFGIDYPDDMDGSKVWDEVIAGNILKIAAYCEGDVERCRLMYQRMKGI